MKRRNRLLMLMALAAVFAITAVFAPQAEAQVCTPPPSNMVSWWGGDNNALDLVSTNHGTLMNGATYAAGMVGQAFSLDGVDDYVDVGNSSSLKPAAFTIDAWVKATAFQDLDTVISHGSLTGTQNSYFLGFYRGTLVFNTYHSIYGNHFLDAPSSIAANEWHHIAGSFDGSTKKLYIDGVLVNSDSVPYTIAYDGAPILIGEDLDRGGAAGIPFNGFIDEVEIFDRALTAEEIAAIYNAGSAGKCRSCTPAPSGMASWWKAENNANDSIGTNDGTLQNGATYAAGKVGQAFSFDGVNDYVEVAHSSSFDLSTDHTVDLWVKLNTAADAILVNKWVNGGEDKMLWVEQGGKIRYWLLLSDWAYASVVSMSHLAVGVWYHVAATYDGTFARIYINGVLDATSAPASGAVVANSSGNLYFAYNPVRPANEVGTPFSGLMDEIGWFNRALSAEEIAAIYKCNLQLYTLTVTKAGTGSGTVTSNPAGINCGADCNEAYNNGTTVTLTASASSGSTFAGWSGDADCSDGVVTMNADKTCTATFTLIQRTLTVTKAGTGTGTVTSNPAGINCGADCSEPYNEGTSVTLTATPAAGSRFTGWSGGCTGTTATCLVSMNNARSVTATFNRASRWLRR